jgi:hypothetical protein
MRATGTVQKHHRRSAATAQNLYFAVCDRHLI